MDFFELYGVLLVMQQLDNNKLIFNVLHIFLLISEIISILFILPSTNKPTPINVMTTYLPLIIFVILLFIEMFKGNKKNELKISIFAISYLSTYLLSKKMYIDYFISPYIILVILLILHIFLYSLSINNIKVDEFHHNNSPNMDSIFIETKNLRKWRYLLVLTIFSISVNLRNEWIVGALLLILFCIILYENLILYKKIKNNKLFLSLIIFEIFLIFSTIIIFMKRDNIYLYLLLINTFKNPLIKRYCSTK